MASRWGHGSLRLLEQAVCELGLAEQGRQGEKSVCLEPSPVLWDLANHEARKGGGTRHGRWHAMPQGQGTLQAAETGHGHFPGTALVGWRGVGTLAGGP